MTRKDKIICGAFFIIAAFFFFLNWVYSHEYHHSYQPVQIETVKEINTIYSPKGLSLAIAATNHHYKATTALQWSVGAGYIDDDSAVSFGLGKQIGKVFVSGNFSSDGTTSAIGIGASGTF